MFKLDPVLELTALPTEPQPLPSSDHSPKRLTVVNYDAKNVLLAMHKPGPH